MKLHYAGDTPEWEGYPLTDRNIWQRWAAQTNGIATPANVISVIGIVLVLWGFWRLAGHHYWAGLWLVAAGRFCDIVDGTVASVTRTKSPLGEAVDVTIDKIAALAAIVAILVAGVAPWWFITVIAIQNLATAAIGFVAHQRGHQIHTIAAGKLGGAAEWGGFLSFVLAAALKNGTTAEHIWTIVAYTSCIVGLGLNSYAGRHYMIKFQAQKYPKK